MSGATEPLGRHWNFIGLSWLIGAIFICGGLGHLLGPAGWCVGFGLAAWLAATLEAIDPSCAASADGESGRPDAALTDKR